MLIDGIEYDVANRTATEGGVTRPLTEVEDAFITEAEEAAARMAEVVAQQQAANDAAETLRAAMFTLTDQIIEWASDAKAFLWTAGAHGVIDVPAFMSLLGTAEGYLLQYKALTVRPQAVTDQRDWMLQRGQEAQSVLALAGVMS